MQKINIEKITNLPKKYQDILVDIIDVANEIYKDNLLDIFLAGSGGRGHIIENWSDLDLYIITNNFDIEKNIIFYDKTKNNNYDIHIGTTFYTKNMIENLDVDSKTIVAFYEHQNYNLNTFIYNNIKIKHIEFKDIISSDKEFNNLLQVVLREIYNYKLFKNNFKTLIKKITLLIKIYIIKNNQEYVYNYNNIFNKFNNIMNINEQIDIENIIKKSYINSEELNYFYKIINLIIKEKEKSMKRICVRGIVEKDNELAVIFRRKINNGETKEYYVIPGGGVEGTENLEEALKRELKEELNIEINVKDLAFKTENEDRIEYFYNCEYLNGTFELMGEEVERNTKENYYEPTFIPKDKINEFSVQKEVKEYFSNKRKK